MGPVLSRPRVVFDVIPVVEERKIVDGAVVARCRSSCVFKVAVKITEAESQRVAGDVDRPEKLGGYEKQEHPQSEDQSGFQENCRSPAELERLSALSPMMSEM